MRAQACRYCGYDISDVPAGRVDVTCPECGGRTPIDEDIFQPDATAFETAMLGGLLLAATIGAAATAIAGPGVGRGLQATFVIVSGVVGTIAIWRANLPSRILRRLAGIAIGVPVVLGVAFSLYWVYPVAQFGSIVIATLVGALWNMFVTPIWIGREMVHLQADRRAAMSRY